MVFLPEWLSSETYPLKFKLGLRLALKQVANTVIHFYFGADLISVISVQAFFT